MPPEFDDELRGALYKNDKGDNPKRPDARGFCKIGGVEYWVSAWTRVASSGKRAGERFQSLAFELKEGQPSRPAPATEQRTEDDDIPF